MGIVWILPPMVSVPPKNEQPFNTRTVPEYNAQIRAVAHYRGQIPRLEQVHTLSIVESGDCRPLMCIMGGANALAGTSDHFLNEGVPPPSLGTVCI